MRFSPPAPPALSQQHSIVPTTSKPLAARSMRRMVQMHQVCIGAAPGAWVANTTIWRRHFQVPQDEGACKVSNWCDAHPSPPPFSAFRVLLACLSSNGFRHVHAGSLQAVSTFRSAAHHSTPHGTAQQRSGLAQGAGRTRSVSQMPPERLLFLG